MIRGRKVLLLACVLYLAEVNSIKTSSSSLIHNRRRNRGTDSIVSNNLHRIRAGSVQRNDSQNPQLPPDNNHRSLFIIQLASFLTMLSPTLVAFAPASALVTKLSSAGTATSILSFLSAGAAVLEIVSSPAIGRLLDTRGRKPVFLSILIAIAVSQGLVVVTSESIWSLCTCKVFGSLCCGLFFNAIGQSILSDLTGSDPNQFSSALGTQSALIGAGFFVAALGGGQLISKLGLSVTYAVATVLTAANLVLVAYLLPETLQSPFQTQTATNQTTKQRTFFSSLLGCTRILRRHRQPIPVLAIVFVLQSLPTCMGDIFQVFFEQEWNLNTQAFTSFVALVGMLGVVSNALGSSLVSRLGMKRYTVLTSFLFFLPSLGAIIFDFPGLVVGHLVGFLGMAQSLGVLGALVAQGKEQGIPIGELAGERASLIALVKIVGPVLYSLLYVQGQRLCRTPKLPFVFNTVLGCAVFGICIKYL